MDPQLLVSQWPTVLGLLLGLVTFKSIIISSASLGFGLKPTEATQIGLILSGGETSPAEERHARQEWSSERARTPKELLLDGSLRVGASSDSRSFLDVGHVSLAGAPRGLRVYAVGRRGWRAGSYERRS